MKKLTLLTLFVVFTTTFSGATFANKIFFVSPTRVELSDSNNVEVVNLTNLSDVPRAYEISIVDIVMTEDGVTKPAEEGFDYSAKRMIRFVPRHFILQPGERQAIRVMARLRPDTPDGSYHSHIMFYEDIKWRAENVKSENEEKVSGSAASLNVEADYQTLIPVIINTGVINTTVDVNTPRLVSSPSPRQYEAHMVMSRQGNGQGTIYTETEHIASDGTTRPVSARTATQIYREVDQRARVLRFNLPEGAPENGDIRLRFFDTNEAEAEPFKEVVLPLP